MRLMITAASLLFSGNLMAATVSVGVTRDTFIQTDGGGDGNAIRGVTHPAELWNYHNGGAWAATPLFFFDLSGYAGQTVTADGAFTVSVLSAASVSRALSLVALTSDFDQGTATFNNSNSKVAGATLDSITITAATGGAVTFTISQATLQSWIDNPSSNYGFGVKAASSTPDISYYASEAGLGTTPTLTFNVVPEPSVATLMGALGLFGLVKRRR